MKIFFLMLFFSVTGIIFGQTIFTQGRYIIGPCGDTLTLRGVNYAPYNWGYNSTDEKIDQIALSGANAVRIAWYDDAGSATPNLIYNNYALLDSVIKNTIAHDMIPIVELHDVTCQNNVSALTALTSFFLDPEFLAIVQTYQHSLIINIANETLFLDWGGDSLTAQNAYINAYKYCIDQFRTNNINIPLMIDAPDCGQNLLFVSNIGDSLINYDPQHNIIFSAHAYWYGYANNDSTEYQAEIDHALAKNIPFVLGEIANLQDDVTMCQYTLNYAPLLRICKANSVSWLAWVWDHDGCSARQVSTNGNFSSLSTYGNDIVNNPDYGLFINMPDKSQYLLTPCVLNIDGDLRTITNYTIYPNPSTGQFQILNLPSDAQVEIFNSLGQPITFERQGSAILLHPSLENGIYILRISNPDGSVVSQSIIKSN